MVNGTPIIIFSVLLAIFAIYVLIYSIFLYNKRREIRKFMSLEVLFLLVIGGLLTILSGYSALLSIENHVCVVHNFLLTSGLLLQSMYFLFLYRSHTLYAQEIILTYIKKSVVSSTPIKRVLFVLIPCWIFHSLYNIINYSMIYIMSPFVIHDTIIHGGIEISISRCGDEETITDMLMFVTPVYNYI